MGYRHNQFNVSATLTANFLLCHLYTTTVAHNAFIADTLVLSAGTLVILGRTKDALTEQTVTLGLIGAVVDGLWLGDLAEGIFQDFFG